MAYTPYYPTWVDSTYDVNGNIVVPSSTMLTAAAATAWDTALARHDETIGAINVRSYGATGNGTTDDTAAVNAALTAAPAGARLYFPPGTYNIVSVNTLNKDITIVGSHNRSSVFSVGTGAYGFSYSGAGTANVTFRDIGFTGSASAQVLLYGTTVSRVFFSDCRFSGFSSDAIQTLGARVSCLRCEFTSDGAAGTKTGVEALQGPQEVTLRQCRFRYLNRGLYCSDSGGAAAHVTLEGNFMDGGWMYLKSTYGNNGATVTYTATALTDTAGAFGALTLNSTVRALAVKRAGTAAQAYQAVINDAAANFVTAGVRNGDIVRTATLWGVVSEVVSATSLYIEEWLTLSDYSSAPVPTAAVGYAIYGLVLGRVQSNTATTITVDQWRDWDGTIVTPTAGTAYELAPHSDYQCYVYRAQKVRITNNTIRRAWSDSISAQTVRDVIITNNNIYDTQDVGITCGQPSGETSLVVTGNRVTHAGTAGIWIGYGHDSEIVANIINTPNWMSLSGTPNDYGGIMVEDSQRMDISHNTILKGLSPNGTKAIHLIRRTGTADSIALVDNSTNGYTTDVVITGGVTNVRGTFQPNTVVALAAAAAGPRGLFSGAGVPAIPASPGSTFLRTDGAVGATLYVKETASTSTVWTAK